MHLFKIIDEMKYLNKISLEKKFLKTSYEFNEILATLRRVFTVLKRYQISYNFILLRKFGSLDMIIC